MQQQGQAYLFGLAAVLCWSTVATAFKLSLRYLDPIQLLLYSCLASIVVLAAVLRLQGRFGLLFSYSRREYLQSLGLGLLNPLLYYLILLKAYDLLPAQEAQALNYTWALTLALLAVPLLKQRLGAREIAAGLVCYSGVLVISTRGDLAGFHFSNPLGVALALGSTVIWALYWIFNTRDRRDPVAGLLLNFLFALPFILLACLLFSDPLVSDVRGLLGALYVGVFEMGITYVLWLLALKRSANAARIGNLIFISPVFSLVFIHLLVGEEILPSTLVGLGLILAGLMIQKLGQR
ncbi:MAG: DMT family transporter [Trichloromonadaceae bacterium]